MIIITNDYFKDLQLAREAGVVTKSVKKYELYRLIDAHNAQENRTQGLPDNAAVDSRKSVSFTDIITAQKNDKKEEVQAEVDEQPSVIDKSEEAIAEKRAELELAANTISEFDKIADNFETRQAKKNKQKRDRKASKKKVETEFSCWREPSTEISTTVKAETQKGKILKAFNDGAVSLTDFEKFELKNAHAVRRIIFHLVAIGYGFNRLNQTYQIVYPAGVTEPLFR